MTDEIKNYFKRLPWHAWLLILAVILGVFFRTYNFQDWLFMKGDQVRDIKMATRTFEGGIGELPLLGPKAGGTFLRLGPIFYYFQSFSAWIFQSAQPPILAYPTLFFSILTIPLFYYLVRKYFTAIWSVVLTTMFSLSFMLIDYSRYAWNPNATPFFIILFIVAILEIFSPKSKRRYFWTVVAAVAFSVATQFHFSAFVTLPIILLLFILFFIKQIREYINWKQVIIFIAIILAFYTPVIISDLMNSGDNTREFISSISNKSDESASMTENFKKETHYFLENFLYLLSGYTGSDKLILRLFKCFILLAFLANVMLLRKEQDKPKKNFLLLILIFFIVFCLIYFPLARSIDKSRFFLPLAHIPFIYLGFIFVYMGQYNFLNKYHLPKILGSLFVIVFLGYNLHMDFQWLWTMNASQNRTLSRSDSFALEAKGNDFWWSWSHFQKIASFINNDCEEKNINFLISKKAKDYKSSIGLALSYIAKDKNINSVIVRNLKNTEGCFYFVSQTDKDVTRDIKNKFILGKSTDLGNVNIIRLNLPKSGEIFNDEISIEDAAIEPIDDGLTSEIEPVEEREITPRQYWKDVWKFFFDKN